MSSQPGVSSRPLPSTVISAAVTACRDALHWRDDLRGVMLAAGVQRSLYDRYDQQGLSKARIARSVFDELGERGPAGYAIQAKIVEELCRMDRPHKDAPDQTAGTAALRDLKAEAQKASVLVDPGQAAVSARKAAEARRLRIIDERRETLGKLRPQFLALVNQTGGNAQTRGYDLEKLLAGLFHAYGLDYRPSYRTEREQVDGSFHFRGFTYLVEARWRSRPPDLGDLLDFKGKVDGKMDSTRGVFISMAGFDEDVLEYFVHNSRGSRNNIIMITGADITQLFDGTFGLEDALTKKIDAAEQEGQALLEL
jgi:Restriction endonuclease